MGLKGWLAGWKAISSTYGRVTRADICFVTLETLMLAVASVSALHSRCPTAHSRCIFLFMSIIIRYLHVPFLVLFFWMYTGPCTYATTKLMKRPST